MLTSKFRSMGLALALGLLPAVPAAAQGKLNIYCAALDSAPADQYHI